MQTQTYAPRQYAQSQPSGYNTKSHPHFELNRQSNQYQQNYQRYGGNSSQGRRNHFQRKPRGITTDLISHVIPTITVLKILGLN